MPKITINLVVYNGEKYIRQCLDSVLSQSYLHELIEINILDNASTDSTLDQLGAILGIPVHQESTKYYDTMIYHSTQKLSNVKLIKSGGNLGMWPGQEELLKYSRGEYVIVLSVDVILNPDFIENAVEVMEGDNKIGALQAKVYKYEQTETETKKTNVIDTAGFKIYRSRRIVNIGHGETDHGQYDNGRGFFSVEGAVPVFRHQALENCRLRSQGNKIVDPDYFWYGDDLDTAWRMKLFGWKQVFSPCVVAWHDRKTTKALASDWQNFIKIRKTVPMFKRRLDWRNTTFTIIKNDFAINLLRDLPYILWRQLRLWMYFLIFEPAMLLELFKVAKMLPKMLKRRNEIMRKAKISARDFRKWII